MHTYDAYFGLVVRYEPNSAGDMPFWADNQVT
jgi:hypothetical protein